MDDIYSKKPEECAYSFTQHRACEFFPCHKTSHPEDFNCLFCYCPLYTLGSKCGGNFRYLENGVKEHERSREYASRIMEAIVTGRPEEIGGNVLNRNRLISNLPEEACVEVPCLVNGYGVQPCAVGALPVQCAAMNMTNINVQLLTIEAARTRKKEHIYQAAMLDPHTGSELDVDTIRKMVDDLIVAHGDYLPSYR